MIFIMFKMSFYNLQFTKMDFSLCIIGMDSTRENVTQLAL